MWKRGLTAIGETISFWGDRDALNYSDSHTTHELYNLNGSIVQYVNYTSKLFFKVQDSEFYISIKLFFFKFKKMRRSGRTF